MHSLDHRDVATNDEPRKRQGLNLHAIFTQPAFETGAAAIYRLALPDVGIPGRTRTDAWRVGLFAIRMHSRSHHHELRGFQQVLRTGFEPAISTVRRWRDSLITSTGACT